MVLLLAGSVGQCWSKVDWLKIKHWIDSADVAGCDTSYVRLPREGFIGNLAITETGTYAHLRYGVHSSDGDLIYLSGPFSTQQAGMLSAGVSYRGWGLSYTRDLSKHGDTEWNFCTYGQTYGAEFRIHHSNSMSGSLDDPRTSSLYDDVVVDVEQCRQHTILANIYYVFNHKRFSLPAAMSNTVIQRRNSGSFMACVNFRRADTHLADGALSVLIGGNSADADFGNGVFRKLRQSQFSIGGGYAYNWVFANRHLLLHGSMMPMMSVWHYNRATYQITVRDAMGYVTDSYTWRKELNQNVSFNASAHFALIHNASRYVSGLIGLINYDSLLGTDHFGVYTVDWSAKLFFGIRF